VVAQQPNALDRARRPAYRVARPVRGTVIHDDDLARAASQNSVDLLEQRTDILAFVPARNQYRKACRTGWE
jgi:hypothetical protein